MFQEAAVALVSREVAVISPKHSPLEKHMVVCCNVPI